MRGAVKARSLGYLCHRLGRNRICWDVSSGIMAPKVAGSSPAVPTDKVPAYWLRTSATVLLPTNVESCCNRRSTEPNKTGFASELGG
jgi:hypothetical protein